MRAMARQQDKCEHSNKYAWVEDGDVDVACAWEETDAPTIAPGCCYGYSYKTNDKCSEAAEQNPRASPRAAAGSRRKTRATTI